jgi:hypothetical protein
MLVVELVELKLVLFPHCLAERQCDQTLTNRIKFDMCYRRPVTVFLIAITSTFLSCYHCPGSAPHSRGKSFMIQFQLSDNLTNPRRRGVPVELVEVKLVLFPHCLAERQCDQTLNQPNKVWHDRRPVTVFLIAITATFLSFSVVFLIALTVFRIVWQKDNVIRH